MIGELIAAVGGLIAAGLSRLRCRLTGHTWGEWSSYSHAGRGLFVRYRNCSRCGGLGTERDV